MIAVEVSRLVLSGILVLLVPGLPFALLFRKSLPIDVLVVSAASLSLAVNPLILLWMNLAGIPFVPLSLLATYAVLGSFAVLIIVSRTPTEKDDAARQSVQWSPLILFLPLLFATVFALRWWPVSLTEVPPGIDTVTHVALIDLIQTRGGIPAGLEPYWPLDSLVYHFGFHANGAAFSWLSGTPPHATIATLGPYLTALIALSVYVLAFTLSDSRQVAIIAAATVGLVSVFPAFWLNWGRVTLSAGMAVVPVAMSLLFHRIWGAESWTWSLSLGILIGGLFLLHYMMFLFLLHGVVSLLLARVVVTRAQGLVPPLRRLAPSGAVSLVLVLPWLLTAGPRLVGAGILSRGSPPPQIFSLARIEVPLSYFSSLYLPVLILLGLLLASVLRKRVSVLFAAWAAVTATFANPYYLPLPGAGILNVPTALMALYVVGSVMVGYIPRVTVQILQIQDPLRDVLYVAVAGTIIVAGLAGTGVISAEGYRPVLADDLEAFAWIEENTPIDAVFATNMMVDRYSEGVQPVDAGIWITYFTERKQLSPSLLYKMEAWASPDYDAQLLGISEAEGRVGSFGSFVTLTRAGATHLYLGSKRTGPMNVDDVLISPWYRVLYHQGDVVIAELKGLDSFDPLVLRPAHDWSTLSDGYPVERPWGVDGVALETYTFDPFAVDYPVYLREAGRYEIALLFHGFPATDFDTNLPLNGFVVEWDGTPLLDFDYGNWTLLSLTLDIPDEEAGLHRLALRSQDATLPFRLSLGSITVTKASAG